MIACENSREFYLVANILPLLHHIDIVALRRHRFEKGPVMRFPLTMPLPQERLFGERVVVKEIEIFGNFWHPTVGEDIGGDFQMDGGL